MRPRRELGCSCPTRAPVNPIGRQELAVTGRRGEARGFEGIQPLTELNEFLARRRGGRPQVLWTRLSERDEVDEHGRQGNEPRAAVQQPARSAAGRRTVARRHDSQPLSRLRAEGRDAGDRPTARNQDAARNRDSEAQRPDERRGDPARQSRSPVPAATNTSSRPKPPTICSRTAFRATATPPSSAPGQTSTSGTTRTAAARCRLATWW